MIRSLLLSLMAILAVFLPGVFASHHQYENTSPAKDFEASLRELQSKCPKPYIWTKSTWWTEYRKVLGPKVLKKCVFLEGKIPPVGTSCPVANAGVVCMFGEAKCAGKDSPETKCLCQNNVWNCTTVCKTLKCPVTLPSGTCDPLVNTDASCEYGEYCCGSNCHSTGFCHCNTVGGTPQWLCAIADFAPCMEQSLEDVGCPCDRPVDGEKCTADYSCGDLCCGTKAYTCHCNTTTGVFESCGSTGFLPKPPLPCSCDTPPVVVDIPTKYGFDPPTSAAGIHGCPTVYPSTGDSCVGAASRFGCGEGACCGGDAYVCTCGADGKYACLINIMPPNVMCSCAAPRDPVK
jgi:hypothetical protein